MQGTAFVQYVVRSHGGMFEVAGNGGNDHHGGASAKAASLQDQHGPLASLLAANGIVKGGAVDFAALNIFHVTGHFLGLGVGRARRY